MTTGQLLKLKPEIQEKVVKWFYDLIISKFNLIVRYNQDELDISYIFNIMFIDFYNLCRILYYTGYGNTDTDMSNNIILNYGGENMYLRKQSKYSFSLSPSTASKLFNSIVLKSS